MKTAARKRNAPRGANVLPLVLRTRPALDEAQVAELAKLGLALEMTVGRPVDVECAYQDGRLYLLQCRPITTLPHA